MLNAARAVNQVSSPADFIFSMNLHDRNDIGGMNTSIFYLAQRKGWNINLQATDLKDIIKQIEAAKHEGARWLVITWYIPELEPWFAAFIPRNLRRG